MKNIDFDWQINEFMIYCRSTQLRPQTMKSYEQTLRLFERWCAEELRIFTVDKVTEPVIRKYVNDPQGREKQMISQTKRTIRSDAETIETKERINILRTLLHFEFRHATIAILHKFYILCLECL